ncbi:ABC transporter ATP-binding protein [Streptomyces sp. NBC_01142]|uniref:ABC transporter ATP-binding protein n=1 Tax=Streptomyces sp. NBC_01142 TaxID=2975865 RepID=UPI002255E71B|nr:ABC transporter ATP-binding protein [Streptomyces sp. NBC_01142]MCX4825200.1 ABC transporter ATP-binding protein [Streptomyces sp. NBC_01142]
MPTDPGPQRAGGDRVPALALRGVSKRYGGTTALEDVALHIAEGEIVGLLGHNGAGKTTLMSLVAGLLRPDAGEIEVRGFSPVRDPRRARRELGLAPQELGVYPPLTVRQNLRFFAELAGLRGRNVRLRTEEVAEPLGLTDLLDRRVSRLSGGEQRRVHTAMALLHRPKLLLLDEPTAGVDVETRARLIAFVRELAADGTAVCYSTHYLAEVEALDASVAILDHGRMIARGTLRELVRSHGDSAVELTFSSDPPSLRLPWPVTHEAGVLRVRVEQPHLAAPEVLSALGESARRLVNLRVVQPSLESVFLRLTGRGYADGPDPAGTPAAATDAADPGRDGRAVGKDGDGRATGTEGDGRAGEIGDGPLPSGEQTIEAGRHG